MSRELNSKIYRLLIMKLPLIQLITSFDLVRPTRRKNQPIRLMKSFVILRRHILITGSFKVNRVIETHPYLEIPFSLVSQYFTQY